ncbi:MAG: shikimate kinase [Eggerthellaceae bacterium]|nr:shikimate kinase [Eggerthellaceae bacterium]
MTRRHRSKIVHRPARNAQPAGGDDKKRPEPKPRRYELTQPVFLIGFMGAGKSTVARRLARACKVASLDLDTYIERKHDRKIKDIFAEDGEEAFRQMESEALRDVAAMDAPLLVSCGGGIIETQASRDALAECGYALLLKVEADEAASRISDRSSRPLFQDMEAARKLCRARQERYEEAARAVVDTSGKDVYRIMCEVRDKLLEEDVLCRIRG